MGFPSESILVFVSVLRFGLSQFYFRLAWRVKRTVAVFG